MLKVDFYNKYWSQHDFDNISFFVCGWAEHKGVVYGVKDLIPLLKDVNFKSQKDRVDFVSQLEGNFTFLISIDDFHYIISDKMRSFQLVYYFEDDHLVVTDDLMKHKKNSSFKFEINNIVCEQLLRTFYVVGPYTLFKEVFSSQSGEIVCLKLNGNKIEREQYFQWAPYMEDDNFQRNYKEEALIQDEIFIDVFKRMVKSAPHVNNWIIPLSGGYDSRTIINYLYKLGLKNVICFSYGMEKNIQSEISKQVADALGYEWHFIDYKFWIHKLNLNVIYEYIEFGFNGVNIPHLQDFPAVFALKELGILQKNDIFVPGHALEVIAGNHLSEKMQYCNNFENVIPTISHHFMGFGYHNKSKSKIFEHVKSIASEYNLKESQIAECFDWQERQTKFIANSVKVYEYFGYESRIPEWDGTLIKYWEKIGFNYRLHRNMFKEVFKKYLNAEEIKHIPFANDIKEKNKISTKQLIINNIPFTVKKLFKKYGINKSFYYVDEGLHIVYSDNKETIGDYLDSYNAPEIVINYLQSYAKTQRLSNFEINALSTLLNIRNAKK